MTIKENLVLAFIYLQLNMSVYILLIWNVGCCHYRLIIQNLVWTVVLENSNRFVSCEYTNIISKI